jgi:hypothetical protein
MGLVGLILTDNVDNLIAKTNVPFVRTRGTGVLNERFPVHLQSPRLIVVGVAADRRSIVAQARRQGREIVIINPCMRVAPHVRHLDYYRATDSFYKITAQEFFTAIRTEFGITLSHHSPAVKQRVDKI